MSTSPQTTDEQLRTKIENDGIVSTTRVKGGKRTMRAGYRTTRRTEVDIKIDDRVMKQIEQQVVDSDQNRSTTLSVFRDWLEIELGVIVGSDWITDRSVDKGIVEATIQH